MRIVGGWLKWMCGGRWRGMLIMEMIYGRASDRLMLILMSCSCARKCSIYRNILLHHLLAMIFNVNHALIDVPSIGVEAFNSIGEYQRHIEAFNILTDNFTL